MKVCSMTYADLEYWVKNKAKPGDLAYYHANNFVYTYHYTKPDDNPKWCMWSDMEKLQEYLSDFGLIDKCLKEIIKLKIEDATVYKRCENCKHWHWGGDTNISFCTHDEQKCIIVPKFTCCAKYEPKEKKSTPFDGVKLYLIDDKSGELGIKYVCEDCGKLMDEPGHWWFTMPVGLYGKPSRNPGFHFRCEECDKKKDGKV